MPSPPERIALLMASPPGLAAKGHRHHRSAYRLSGPRLPPCLGNRCQIGAHCYRSDNLL